MGAADADFFAEGVAGTEKIVDNVGADDGDVRAVLVFNLGE